MDIIIPPNFISSLKNKHLLLDTNIFLDVITKPTVFYKFFETLKENDITLVNIDQVKYELLKGSSSIAKYQEREKLVTGIVDTILPITQRTTMFVYELIKIYGIDGTAVHVTDLFLGATLMQYGKNIYLFTRDTTDFMQRIFDIPFILNLPYAKGINTYGVYSYKNK